MHLTGCPRRIIPGDVWDLLDYAALFKEGVAPEPGGALDQAAGFVAAAKFVWSEHERMKAEAMEKELDR